MDPIDSRWMEFAHGLALNMAPRGFIMSNGVPVGVLVREEDTARKPGGYFAAMPHSSGKIVYRPTSPINEEVYWFPRFSL